MCDVCREEGFDWKFHNGDKPLMNCRFYRVYRGQTAQVTLCHIHSIELFCIGENRFLESHPSLAILLHSSSRPSSSVFSFG